MSADTLKECPHCGSPAQLEDCRTIWRAICTSAACGALVLGDRAPEPEDGDEYPAGYWEAFEKSAIDRWNARPAIAPPVAAGSVDTIRTMISIYRNLPRERDEANEEKREQYLASLISSILAWGAQQREAGRQEGALVSLKNYDAACDEYRKQIAALTVRTEKAEAEQDTLKESLRLVNEDHGLWMARTHAAEDARDDALARIKELEERVEKLDTLHGASTA